MAANLDLVSVDYLTNPWVIWSDFLWLIGVTGEKFLSMTSGVAPSRWPSGSHIGFHFCQSFDERLG
jgi:hypothetical protein